MERACLENEVSYSFVRSSGAGGQHVNKVATKVVITFDLFNSQCLSEKEQSVIAEKLSNRISKEGIFSLSVSASRSQYKNKKEALNYFLELIEKALLPIKTEVHDKKQLKTAIQL